MREKAGREQECEPNHLERLAASSVPPERLGAGRAWGWEGLSGLTGSLPAK